MHIAARLSVEDRGFSTPCWVWQKYTTEKGYARSKVPGFGHVRIHRAAYELLVGPIPDGLTIDHLCRVKACCNPAHLEPVTSEENIRRAHPFAVQRRAGNTAPREQRTHCAFGHELTSENRCSHGCRICHNAYMREYMKSRPPVSRKEYHRQWKLRRKAREAA